MSDWNWFGKILIMFYMAFYLNYYSDVYSENNNMIVSTSKKNILVSVIVIILFIFSFLNTLGNSFEDYVLLVYLIVQSIAIFSTAYLILSGIDKKYMIN